NSDSLLSAVGRQPVEADLRCVEGQQRRSVEQGPKHILQNAAKRRSAQADETIARAQKQIVGVVLNVVKYGAVGEHRPFRLPCRSGRKDDIRWTVGRYVPAEIIVTCSCIDGRRIPDWQFAWYERLSQVLVHVIGQ